MQDPRRRIIELEHLLCKGATQAELLRELGALKLSIGDVHGAIAAYQRCVGSGPEAAEVLNNLGVAQLRAGLAEAAIESFGSAIARRPDYQRPRVNIGKALREVGRITEAVQQLRIALQRMPDYPPALVNLGDALVAQGDLQGGIGTLMRATCLAPESPEAWVSLAAAHAASPGGLEAAIETLQSALGKWPHFAAAHMSVAKLLFAAGRWEAAWPHFEYRFRSVSQPVRLCVPAGAQPWDGSASGGADLFLLGEQGLGDQIQFARYAHLLAETGVRTTIGCDARLVRLLSRAGLADCVRALDGLDAGTGASWAPLMSLPAWHKTRPDSVPLARGYIAMDPQQVTRWRLRLTIRGPRVGLVWAGNTRRETGSFLGRSPPFEALAPLFQVTRCGFVSLQRDTEETSLSEFPFADSMLRLPDLDAGPDAFVDSAAILTSLDLLITCDTAAAHLSGAMGVETWLCLKYDPDWRWMQQGDTTAWYASMRLFRQTTAGDWTELYCRVARALDVWCAERA